MSVDEEAYRRMLAYCTPQGTTLVAVSKTKPVSDILALYQLGQRDFGENYVQELVAKHSQLPNDIRWHFIGHLQTNKVRQIAPFVHLIHGVDRLKLLRTINQEAEKCSRIIQVLLQMHISKEETKFGMNEEELTACLQSLEQSPLTHVRIAGFMGMASFISDEQVIRKEFESLAKIADKYFPLFKRLNPGETDRPKIISMGMSGDYRLAIEEGSNMVRIGSLLFGARNT